ncbi:MAG TPA: ATP-binding cassette domain-containing protein, partial [Actinomycetota bacterium]|nr:ATP-binding cassette domain-containing protein [Actinomycetota bacterium]
GSGRVDALKGIDASIPMGKVTAVVGPSGSGKSSLLRILAGLDRPTEGSAEVAGTDVGRASAADLRRLRRRIGYVFQRPSDNLVSYLTVKEHVILAARLRKLSEVDADEILHDLGLGARANHHPEQLSGGEQQRAAFAQAVAGDPPLVVADEPTAEIDSTTAEALLSTIRKLADRGLTIVVATHDPAVMGVTDTSIRLHHGEVVGR